ncbi:DUF4160 domain-containing protein [Achromobacter aloeverae]|uniref:DUF4160 domain-containing protein n=1 Tax=Achromobacter aloeverae TaxID=1750518 RepID=A0A4Q1HPG9_9BURK|nr:DUF4160 domain-containing protein [Achromobacter aloeverae]
MKICSHKGLVIAILTRNEHCPPHVHVGTERWNARFTFSFWHNGVRLWDVTPARNEPTVVVLEELRQAIKRPLHLRKARGLWWRSRQTLCLDRQWWDVEGEEVVSARAPRAGALAIESARFDAQSYKTVLTLAGRSTPLEIEL